MSQAHQAKLVFKQTDHQCRLLSTGTVLHIFICYYVSHQSRRIIRSSPFILFIGLCAG